MFQSLIEWASWLTTHMLERYGDSFILLEMARLCSKASNSRERERDLRHVALLKVFPYLHKVDNIGSLSFIFLYKFIFTYQFFFIYTY